MVIYLRIYYNSAPGGKEESLRNIPTTTTNFTTNSGSTARSQTWITHIVNIDFLVPADRGQKKQHVLYAPIVSQLLQKKFYNKSNDDTCEYWSAHMQAIGTGWLRDYRNLSP